MSRKPSSFLYAHRLMRVFSYLDDIKSKRKGELMTKSSMISSLLGLELARKLEIEAGALSYIPQYCKKFKKKPISKLFGNDVCALVQEVNEMRLDFLEGSDPHRGCSMFAKNIYSHQCYVDLIRVLTCDEKESVEIDGETFKRVEAGFIVQGEVYPVQEFHNWLFDCVRWKLDYLEYASLEMQQALREIIKMYKDQKGFVFMVDGSYYDADKDECPVI